MNSTLKKFVPYLKPYLPSLLLSVTLALVFTAANIYFLPLSRDIINELSNKDLTRINNQILNAVGLYFLRLLTQYGQMYIMSVVSAKVLIDIQEDFLFKIQQLSQTFYSKYKLGDLMTRVFGDTGKIRDTMMMVLSEGLPLVCSLIGVLGYLLFMNFKLTLFTLLAIPVFVALISKTSEQLKRLSRQDQRKISDVGHVVQEVLSNIKTVQSNTMEKEEVTKFRKLSEKSFKISNRIVRVKYRLEPLISFLQFVVIAMVLWYGGYQMASGEMTGASLASFFTGILMMIDPVLSISRMASSVRQSGASFERVFEVFDFEDPISSPENPVKLSKIEGKIVFENVRFSYRENTPEVLKGIDIVANPGTVTALVGLSGSGKSTIINLIPRFYDPKVGTVTLDGVDLKQLDLYDLRSRIAIVPQEDVLFRGTIMENVSYGKPGATEEEVIQALKLANAWEFVERTPGKLRGGIGDRGRRLSGGQKQRISIARAILRNPKILILDEATSSLDAKSERLVQDALKTLMTNRTTFVIAHRLSTISHADQILVLDNGLIVERGTHDELLAMKGHYSQLYDLQFKKTQPSYTDDDPSVSV